MERFLTQRAGIVESLVAGRKTVTLAQQTGELSQFGHAGELSCWGSSNNPTLKDEHFVRLSTMRRAVAARRGFKK